MTSTLTKKTYLIQYSEQTLKRAKRALSCSSLSLNLFQTMIEKSVSLLDISKKSGLNKGYCNQEMSENKVENEIMWLIKVGILRREVDGQGITDSFRLTPLGREIVNNYDQLGQTLINPSFWDYIINKFNRWFSWLV